MQNLIPLTELGRALHEYGATASYPRLWRAVCDGRIPAERVGRQWFIDPDNVPEIAAMFAPKGGAK